MGCLGRWFPDNSSPAYPTSFSTFLARSTKPTCPSASPAASPAAFSKLHPLAAVRDPFPKARSGSTDCTLRPLRRADEKYPKQPSTHPTPSQQHPVATTDDAHEPNDPSLESDESTLNEPDPAGSLGPCSDAATDGPDDADDATNDATADEALLSSSVAPSAPVLAVSV